MTGADVLRSLGRHVALALGPSWEVRWAVGEGDFERPFARITANTPAASTPIGAHHAELRQSFAIVAFPGPAEYEEQAALEAAAVQDALWRAFARGVGAGHPLRVPVYDYTLRSLTEGAREEDRLQFARVVEPVNVHATPDPAEDLAWLVIADLRLAWTRATADLPAGPLAAGVSLGGGG